MWRRNPSRYETGSKTDNTSGAELLLSTTGGANKIEISKDGLDEELLERRGTKTSFVGDKSKNRRGRCLCIFRSIVSFVGEDWLHLVLLGMLMGIFSFTIDLATGKLRQLHFFLSNWAGTVHWSLQYSSWVLFSLTMVMISSTLCHYIAPQAAGSGIPEMKTILRGVVLKEYLTWKTLATKFVGLVLALGSDLPFGKEGPFVHIASMLARLLSRLVVSFQGIYENESRSSEMLSAACAVGIASTYGAPVGGVLFSIEVTSVFFPLRNYWRGFLSTVCSAITFRLLLVWSGHTDTVVAFSVTHFPSDYPFDPKELIFFALIGLACGFGGALFVWTHQKYVRYVLQNPRIKRIMQKHHYIYPAVVTVVIASLKCPLGYGKYFAGGLTPREAIRNLSSNFSWNDPDENNTSADLLLSFWADSSASSFFLVLFLFAVNMFWMTVVANTIPVPCGVFIPVFVTGAAFGRLVGEALCILFPNGVRTDGVVTKLVPGAYALVGATAFAGAVTHAISTSVIVVEMTGQIIYILPLTLAVLLANAVCARLQPSIYDSIIRLKKLPYLPQISPTSSAVHRLYVADFAVRDVKFLSLRSTYRELRDLLQAMPKLKSFPLVDAPSSRILLGSIRRSRLARLLDSHIGEAARRRAAAIKKRFDKSPVTPDEAKTPPPPPTPKLLVNGTGIVVQQETSQADSQNQLQARFVVRRVRSCETLAEAPITLAPVETTARCQSEEKANDTTLNGSQRPNAFSDTHYHTISAEPRRSKSFLMALSSYMQELPQRLRRSFKRSSPHHDGETSMTSSELIEWENMRLDEQVDFERLKIDPAPFQLVEKTSLHKAHSLFWILGLNRAYVTCLGRLVGVVALRELRQALERAQLNEVTRTMSRGASSAGANVGGPVAKLRKRLRRRNRRPPSLGRYASTTTSTSLVPGQAEALQVVNFSLPSTPDAWRRNAETNAETPRPSAFRFSEIDKVLIEEGGQDRRRHRNASSVSLYENAHSEQFAETSSDGEDDFVSYSSGSDSVIDSTTNV